MRLHSLSATAFGPFVDTVSVDFDDLSAGGLFLLTGDTGAGKTSVLDAVCFALYGEVPGDRHTARHLRSDHADPGAEPRVELELTVAERTFRFTRSPSWERPKKRGKGTTKVQAHVVVEELRGATWTTLTNRLDEAGQLVTHLLGMTCAQFTQVAMLPQNRFQAFLRASSADRQAVLQRLFRTERFESVERWLAERRLGLHRQSQVRHDEVAAVLNRFQEAAGSGVPDDWDVRDLGVQADDGSLLAWATTQHAAAATSARESEESLAAADDCFAGAQQRLADGRDVADRRRRATGARQALRDLTETAMQEDDLVRRLDGHSRAAPVLPLIRRAGALTTSLDDAEESAQTQLADLADRLGRPVEWIDVTTVEDALTLASETRAVAESWLPREQELAAEHTRVETLADEVESLGHTLEQARAQLAELTPRRRALTHQAAAEARVAATLTDRRARVEQVEIAAAAAHQSRELGRQLGEQRESLALVVTRVQDLREEHLDLREARIQGMAAELAVGLAVGCSCPVCGSSEHPSPASSSSRITRDDEEQARDRHELAAFEQQALQESVATLETQLHGTLVRSEGHQPTYWQRRLQEARAAAQAADRACARETEIRAELDQLEAREQAASSRLSATGVSLAGRSAALEHATVRRDALEAELGALLHGHDEESVAALVAHQAASVATLTLARSALHRLDKARVDQAQAVADTVAAAQEAGFQTARQALAAHLADDVHARLEAELEQRRSARAAATAVLADPVVKAALDALVPDLDQLGSLLEEASAQRDHAHTSQHQATSRARRLGVLLAELTDALQVWQPVRRDHAVAATLSSLVEGKSADNAWRMRLSAYVLSERLRQVVEAANERLASMTDTRFTLEQADERGAGEQRGGLSLRVRDQWSGKQRDPATLSGGETFLVSLALALGLADTVSHEAGGTQLDTLFIDEGFGALDATTLDAVMDTLDSLRDGGRVVGLVSHVPELRTRITTQLEVRKARRGSTVAVGANA
jgi:exonuclease SbcC